MATQPSVHSSSRPLVGSRDLAKFLRKSVRYIKCYSELAFGGRPETLEGIVDYCGGQPILMGQARSEILQLAKILQAAPPKRSMEIGTGYGGTLFFLCSLSPPDAQIISVDLPPARRGGGYSQRKVPLFRRFVKGHQKLHLVRGDSHSPETKKRVMEILNGEKLDYLFVDADHTYLGVRRDFEMYSPLVQRGGMIVFHDIVAHGQETECQVKVFWDEIKNQYRHFEIVEGVQAGSMPIGITGRPMKTAGLGVLFMD